MMRLHYDSADAASRAVLLFAASQGLRLEMVELDMAAGEHLTYAFGELSPARTLPLLEDGALRLPGGAPILRYLAELTGSDAWPKAPAARARVDGLLDWFAADVTRDFLHGVLLAEARDDDEWPNPAMRAVAVQRARQKADQLLTVLDRDFLPGTGGPFLGGAAPCLADYLGASILAAGVMARYDIGRWPGIAAWLRAMRGLPAWRGIARQVSWAMRVPVLSRLSSAA